VERNTFAAASDGGVVLLGSSGNVLEGNEVTGVSDAAMLVEGESNGNRIEGNTLTASDAGILIDTSVGNLVIGNTVHGMSDNGVDLGSSHGSVVLANDLRSNGGGIEMFDSTGTRLEANDTSQSTGTAIQVEGASAGNALLRNVANDNGSGGIDVIALAAPGEGNLVEGNTASRNQGMGIDVSTAGHTITSNVTDGNSGWGIYAVDDNRDGGGNRASGNSEPSQCSGVVCNSGLPPMPDTDPPDTEIVDQPLHPSAVSSATFAFEAEQGFVPRFECSLDGAAFEPCSSPHRYAGLSVADHAFAVRAIDLAGNVDVEPAVYSWTIVEPPPVDCGSTVTLAADADAWIDQNSATTNKGTDSALKVRSKGPSDNFRTLVRFPLPEVPQDCVLDVATLRLHADGTELGRSLLAIPLDGDWSEGTVTWSNQPPTAGSGAAVPTGEGYRAWNVKTIVQAMYDAGVSHGFRIQDAVEGADAEHSFNTREDENEPQLVLQFVPSVDPLPPPPPPDSAAPDTTILSGPPPVTSDTTAVFAFESSETGSSFACSLDGAAFTACTSPATLTGLGLGDHQFAVRAADPAGNTDPSPAQSTWTVVATEVCARRTVVTVDASADAWLLQTSPTANYGDDSVMKVDTKAEANARALVRFALPGVPNGCRLVDAELRLYASSSKPSRTLEVVRVAADWTESAVTWANQPGAVGVAAAAASGDGWRSWNVVSQVQSMYTGRNFGFLVRDLSEDGVGIEQQFHTREKSPDNSPQLVITFG
jgi:parallel beta-helix repeat protein